MFHRCLPRLAAAFAVRLILFFSMPAIPHASAEGNIIRAAEGGEISSTCGADWAHACELQYALTVRAQPGDEIWVKAGTYYPTTNPTDRNASFVLRDGVSLYGGFAGTETARDQRDWQNNRTILSGDIDHNDLASPALTADQIQGINSLHVVYAYDVIIDTYMDGFIITAGLASSTEGGGVLISVSGNNPPPPGTTHLSNVHIMGSRARQGGGIFFNHSGTLTDALVSGCAADQEGGGISIHGEPTLTRVTMSGNTAQGGGGMEMTWSAPVLTDLVFTGNTASLYGGGLHTSYAAPIIDGAVFNENFANNGGGAMYIDNSDTQFSGMTIENNATDGPGGAIYNNYSILTLRDSLLANNSALRGGGMYSFENAAELTNVTVTGNTASQEGGGLYLESASYENAQVMKHVTIANNTSTNGGGLYVQGNKPPEIRNSIVWGNLGLNNTLQIVGSVSAQSSVIEGGLPGGVYIRSDDPYLGPLSDVGGKVRVRPLLPGSSAIDFSTAGYCPDTDSRGVSRPQGAGCDAGAYESRPFQMSILGGNGQSTPVYRFYPLPLEIAVTSEYGDPVDGGRLFIIDSTYPYATFGHVGLTITGGKTSVWGRARSTQGSHTVWFGPISTATAGDPVTFAFNLTNTAPVPGIIRTAEDGVAVFAPCGESWQNACSFPNGVNFAGPGDEIWAKAGTYRNPTEKPIDLPKNVAVYGGFAGTETTRVARDWEANVTILSGDTDRNDLANPIIDLTQIQGRNSVSVVSWQSCGQGTLDGFTITGANSQSGIRMRSCDATLRNLIIQGNMSDEGGGISAYDSHPQISNVIFRYNHASVGGGGLVVRGILAQGSRPIQLENLTFESNTSVNSGGGAIVGGMDIQMKGVTFIDNTAGSMGGGLSVGSVNQLLLSGGIFHGNQALSGGGLYISSTSSNQVVENATFSANSATHAGAAISLDAYAWGGYCDFRQLTIVGNSANVGGGAIFNGGSDAPSICNSILWNNGPNPIIDVGGPGNHTIVENSIVEGGDVWGDGIITADPLLAPMGDYGGGTQTFALLPGSPAIDAANEYVCPAVDQRGVTRPQGSGCDMGAFESRGFTLTVTDGAAQSTMITQPFVNPLAVLVHSAANEPVEGGLVTFTPPAQGASAVISGSPARIIGERAAVTAQANETVGAYQVNVGGRGIEAAIFHLLNLSAPATVKATVLNSPVVYGEPLSFRALVQSDVGTPAGKVQFYMDGVNFGDMVDLVGGVASLEWDTVIPAGSHELTAVFLGGPSHQAASTDMPVSLTIEQASTSVRIYSSGNPAILDTSVKISAVINVVSPGRGLATGSVIFTVDGGQEVSMPLVDGVAELMIVANPLGSHVITAKYTGDANFTASPTADFTLRVENPSPILNAIEPAGVFEDGPGFTLTIRGEAFAPAAVVRWNGIDITTEWVDATTLRVEIPSEWIEEPREVQITVFNPEFGGGESGAVVFTVYERMRLYLPMVVSE